MKIASECGMRIPEADQIQESTHHGVLKSLTQFRARIVMTVDVAARAGPSQQIQVIRTRQEPNVIDLGHPWSKELNGTGDQVIIIPAAEGIVEGAIDLIQIQVVCSCSSGLSALAVAAL